MELAMSQDCDTTLDSLSLWLQDEKDGLSSPAHQELTAHIHNCPTCTQRLAALRSLEQATEGMVSADIAEQEQDTTWLDQLMSNIVLETFAGRNVPLSAEYDVDQLSITEGAIIAAIRDAVDALDNTFIGRCRLVGDIDIPDEPVIINATASVRRDVVIEDAADRLREIIAEQVNRLSELNVQDINVEVQDLDATSSAEKEKL